MYCLELWRWLRSCKLLRWRPLKICVCICKTHTYLRVFLSMHEDRYSYVFDGVSLRVMSMLTQLLMPVLTIVLMRTAMRFVMLALAVMQMRVLAWVRRSMLNANANAPAYVNSNAKAKAECDARVEINIKVNANANANVTFTVDGNVNADVVVHVG